MRRGLFGITASALVVVFYHAWIWILWTQGQKLWALVLGTVLALSALWILFRRKTPVPTGEPEGPGDAEDVGGLTRGHAWLRMLLGIAFVQIGYLALWRGQLTLLGMALVGAVFAWRPVVGSSQRDLSAGQALRALAVVLTAAALLRVYRLGDIPFVFADFDEGYIWAYSRELVKGLRQSFATAGQMQDGIIPFAAQAFFLALFGDSLWASRLSGAVSGTLMVALTYGLVRQVLDRTTALAAAIFMGFGLWPLTFSRAQYLMNESLVVFLAWLFFALWAWRHQSKQGHLLAGFFWGLCFSTYKASQLVLGLAPLLWAILWLGQPSRRAELMRGLWAYLLGALVGSAFLLQWAWSFPRASEHYFGFISAPHLSGAGITGDSLPGRLNQALQRTVGRFPAFLEMFTTKGSNMGMYFPKGKPIVEPLGLWMVLAGLVIALIRFKNPLAGFAFILFFVGMLPALAGNPNDTRHERRAMLMLPAMALLAGLGMRALIQTALVRLAEIRWRRWCLGLLGCLGVLLLAQTSWLYFGVYQKDRSFLSHNRANVMALARGLAAELSKTPASIVSTWCPCNDNWRFPMGNRYIVEVDILTPGVTKRFMVNYPDHAEGQGIFKSMRDAVGGGPKPARKDLLVVLESFYFYLAPFLTDVLGAEEVRAIPMVVSPTGPVTNYLGLGPPSDIAFRIFRLRDFDPSVLEGLDARHLYGFEIQRLLPPGGDEMTAKMMELKTYEAQNMAEVRSALALRDGWRVKESISFSLPDPYFYLTTGRLVRDVRNPYRLSARWSLHIPEKGIYRLGASSSVGIRILLDGQQVHHYVPDGTEKEEVLRTGQVGAPLELDPGFYELHVDQAVVSNRDTVNHLFRLVWQVGDGPIETIPLEALNRLRERSR